MTDVAEIMARAMWEDAHDGSWPADAEGDMTLPGKGISTAQIYRLDAKAALAALDAAGFSVVRERAASTTEGRREMTHELSERLRAAPVTIYCDFGKVPICQIKQAELYQAADELDRFSSPAPLPEEIEEIRKRHTNRTWLESNSHAECLILLRALEAKTRECETLRSAALPSADQIEALISDNTFVVDGGCDAYVDGCSTAAEAILSLIRADFNSKGGDTPETVTGKSDAQPHSLNVGGAVSVPVSDFVAEIEAEGFHEEVAAGREEVRKWMNPVTDAEIAELETLANAAAPGPWRRCGELIPGGISTCKTSRTAIPRLIAALRASRAEMSALKSKFEFEPDEGLRIYRGCAIIPLERWNKIENERIARAEADARVADERERAAKIAEATTAYDDNLWMQFDCRLAEIISRMPR